MIASNSTKERQASRRLIHISHNRGFPSSHLEAVLLPLFEQDYTEESLRVTIDSANHVWGVYEKEKCVACALITDIGSHDGLYVILFGVIQSAQGLGIGTRLLRKIIKWSRKRQRSFIYLLTESANARAIRLYEKAGFERYYRASAFDEPLPEYGEGVLPMMLWL